MPSTQRRLTDEFAVVDFIGRQLDLDGYEPGKTTRCDPRPGTNILPSCAGCTDDFRSYASSPENRRLAILAVCAVEWEMFLTDAVVETTPASPTCARLTGEQRRTTTT